MKAIVVGYGSIGKRHVRVLNDLGVNVAVVSGQELPTEITKFSDLKNAIKNWEPGYIIVANKTHEHYNSLRIISEEDFKGKVLVEKPLFDKVNDIPPNNFSDLKIAYNLRSHPLLKKIKTILDGNKKSAISVNVYVGSYLPGWRQDMDYKNSYSASKEMGGGVLRDLSHELDYILWIFGPWKKLTALSGHFSNLQINSDDAVSILMETTRCPLVSIHLNYLDRRPRREILINTNEETIKLDLIANIMEIGGDKTEVSVDRDFTYKEEHLAMLNGDSEDICSAEEACFTLTTIAAIEKASESKIWIQRT
ncbi:gfo/Idh/MocA family oxidoreductase [Leptospira ilyithenensis]|uniref:Gfo/Idh/MocA family oxidoreductase n=1 Tax=Leptospira ilyithenensis TaxID=2484901 RepID=A0A4R9LRC3_9LEPT|nr:gfo/Idh/MocA family oxidoreductase [Leptospira ilyithenensis]